MAPNVSLSPEMAFSDLGPNASSDNTHDLRDGFPRTSAASVGSQVGSSGKTRRRSHSSLALKVGPSPLPPPISGSTYDLHHNGISGSRHRKLPSLPIRRLSRFLPFIASVMVNIGLVIYLLQSRSSASIAAAQLKELDKLVKAHDDPDASHLKLSNQTTSRDTCEYCLLNWADPMCRYGLDNIRLSRAYEGSGFRVQKVIEKALRGERIKIGVLGASVTAGHFVRPPDAPLFHDVFFKDWKSVFPNSEFHLGAAPGKNSNYFMMCFSAEVPDDLDLYILELDVNNEMAPWIYDEDDALYRGLLGLPQQPAVIRVSIPAISFPDLARGTTSTLLIGEFHDIPVISIKNIILPSIIAHPDTTGDFFALNDEGGVDGRHINADSHYMLGDMMAIYMREQICKVKQRKQFSLPPVPSPWPQGDALGELPRQKLLTPWQPDYVAPTLNPSCKLIHSTRSPLVPLPGSQFRRIDWNGKSAFMAERPGDSITFAWKGSRVGVFVYVTNGINNPVKSGKIRCVIDEEINDRPGGERIEKVVDAHVDYPVNHCRFFDISDQDIESGDHTLTCTILEESSTKDHQVRIQGIGTM